MKKAIILLSFILVASISASAYDSPPKETNFFRMNESSSPIIDYSGNNDDADVLGSPVFGTSGVSKTSGDWGSGEAIDFSGSSDYLKTSDKTFNSSSAYSMCGWVKISDTASAGDFDNPIAKYETDADSADEDGFGFFVNDQGTVHVATDGGNTVSTAESSGTAIDDGSFHHTCFEFDMPNNQIDVYVDGGLDYEVTSYTDDSSATVPLLIGSDGGNNGDMVIDEFRAIEGEINSTEVNSLYENNTWPSTEDTEDGDGDGSSTGIASYHFNESSSPSIDYFSDYDLDWYNGVSAGATGFDENLSTGQTVDLTGDAYLKGSGTTPGELTGSQTHSFFTWVKTSNFSSSDILTGRTIFHTGGRGATGTGNKLQFREQNGKLRVEINNGGYTSGLQLSSGEWHFVGYTFKGNQLNDFTLYLDDQSEQVSGTTSVSIQDNLPIYIGAANTTGDAGDIYRNWDGFIDETRIYSKELNSTEISALQQCGSLECNQEDNPPELSIDSAPTEGTSVQTPFRINVTASDSETENDTGIDRVVYSADNFTTTKDYRTSEGDLVIQDLAGDTDGTGQIKIKAVDNAGNENVKTLSYSELNFIAFGEGHFHTEYNEFSPSITNDELFTQIQDTDKLDWIAPTEHAQLMSDTQWSNLKSTLDSYNSPGEFTTFLGFEHTEGAFDDTTEETSHGQTHFIYRDYDSGTARYGSDQYNLTEAFEDLDNNAQHPFFASSQHQVNNIPWPDKSGWNYTVMNKELSEYNQFRQIETYQRRGSALAEWQGFNDNNGLIGIYKNYTGSGHGFNYTELGYERSSPGWGIFALGMDWTGGRLGIMGTSDSHMQETNAIPGSCEIDDNHDIMIYGGGSTGVYTNSLNRTSVWNAMNATDTYTTQCKRASVKVSVNGSLNPRTVSPDTHTVNVVASPLDGSEITSITLWDDMNRTHEQAGLVEHREYNGEKYVNASFSPSGEDGDIYIARIT